MAKMRENRSAADYGNRQRRIVDELNVFAARIETLDKRLKQGKVRVLMLRNKSHFTHFTHFTPPGSLEFIVDRIQEKAPHVEMRLQKRVGPVECVWQH